MSVKYIPPSKNVGESVHDINDNFAALDKQNESIAQTVANKADATDVQDLATQLNDKADTSDLEAKVSNDQTGATELLNTLTESKSTPQNEDSIILKHLNQYVRTPFTSLWNWIKSNLAKVATSGSYNDLSDEPDIPTVDSSFSENSTNAVAGNVILSALNSKANKTELQALSNQVSNKADVSHNHDSAYAAKNHTHNYAGSSTAGGSATTANALTSKNIGSDTQPVYFNSTGTPSPIKYTLGNVCEKTIKTATAVSSAACVNLATGQKYIPDMAFISYWNGAVNDQGGSNLKYCNKGAFGTAATKDVDTTVKSRSTNLITSDGVSTALSNKVSTTSNTIIPTWWCGTDTANTAGYYHFMTVTMSQHGDFNMTLLITNDYGYRNVGIFNTHIRCDSATTTNAPDHMDWLVRRGWAANAIIAVVSGLTVKYYINQVVPQFSGICFKALSVSSRRGNSAKYTTVFSTAPTTGLKASATSSDNSIVSDATKWNGLTDDTMTANTTDTRLMVLNGNKVQYRQIDTLPFLSSNDLAQPVLYTSTTATTSATITGLFDYSLIWFQVVGSKTTHTHILPLAYLKSKGSLTFKDGGTPINILYVSDTQIRWFEYQGQGAESYTSVTIVKII